MIRLRQATAVALVGLIGLAGCGTDGPIDAVSSINPFKQEEQLLPGERRSVLTGSDPLAQTTNQSARIGAAIDRRDWPQPGGPATNAPGNIAASITGNRAWSIRAGRSEGGSFGVGTSGIRVSARPVSDGSAVFVYDPFGTVSAHSVSGGGSLWRVSVRPANEKAAVSGGGIALDQGRLFAATGFGEVVALETAGGAKIWTTRIDAGVRGAPTAGSGKVFVVSQAGTVNALDQATGAIAWTAETSGRGRGLLASASPAVAGDVVVVPTSSGDILALDQTTGKQKWSASVIGGSRQSAVAGLQDASASPVIADGIVYATGVGGRTIAVRLEDGQTVWQQAIGSAHTPVKSGDALFMVDLSDRLVAFDATTGAVLWAKGLPQSGKRRSTWAGPVLIGNRLWLISATGDLITADAATGEVSPVGALPVEAPVPPIVAGGLMLAVGADGTLVAVN